MKTPIPSILGAAALFVITSSSAGRAAVIITDFGSDEYTPTYTDFASNAQTSSQISLVGVENNLIFGTLSAPVSIVGFTGLTITGLYTGSFNGQFVVDLYDGDDDSTAYNGFYANFTPGVSTTVTLAFVDETGSFNPADIVMVGFTAGTLGGSASVDLQITELSAVPEPATWASVAGALLVLAALRFRRRRRRMGAC